MKILCIYRRRVSLLVLDWVRGPKQPLVPAVNCTWDGGSGLTRRRKRSPWLYLVLLAVIIALGIGSRRFGRVLPGFVAAFAGDTLWALAAFVGIGLILSSASTWRVATLAFLLAVLVEVSQLYHAPWIDSIRDTTLGALVLGHGFLWSDLGCYAVGVGIGILFEITYYRSLNSRLPVPPSS